MLMDDGGNETFTSQTTSSGVKLSVDTSAGTNPSPALNLKDKKSPKPPKRRTSLDWRRKYTSPPDSPPAPTRNTSLDWRDDAKTPSASSEQNMSCSAKPNATNDDAPVALQISTRTPEPATGGPLMGSLKKTADTSDVEEIKHIDAANSAPDDWEMVNFDNLNLHSGSDSGAGSDELEEEEKRLRVRIEAFANECFELVGSAKSTQRQKDLVFDNIKSRDQRKLVREIANEVGLEHRTTQTPEGHKCVIVFAPERATATAIKTAHPEGVVKSSPARTAWVKPVASAHVKSLGCVPGSSSGGWVRADLQDIKHVLELTYLPELSEHHVQQALAGLAPAESYSVRFIAGQTTALLVFRRSEQAQKALRSFAHPFFSLKPLERASAHTAAAMASSPGIEAEVRRKKDASVARRFIIHALGGMRKIKANNTPPTTRETKLRRSAASSSTPTPDRGDRSSRDRDTPLTRGRGGDRDTPLTRGRGASHFNPADWT